MDAKTANDWFIACQRWDGSEPLRNFIIGKAREETEKKHLFTIRYILENARRCEFTGRDGVTFKVNNTLAPAYARLLLRDYPECRPYLETRKSRFDGMV